MVALGLPVKYNYAKHSCGEKRIMRRLLVIIVILILLLCSCGYPDNGYSKGFADGYAAGYEAAIGEVGNRSFPDEIIEDRSIPEPAHTEKPSPSPAPASAPSPATSPAPADDFPVYVSRNGVMHKRSNCSGMVHYTEMPYSVAKDYYTKKCSKCFK